MQLATSVEEDGFTPGFCDMSNEDYHADRSAVSSSRLRTILVSPAHYMAGLEERHKTTPTLELGSAIHCAVLEHDRFEQEYVVAIKFDRRTKDGKARAEEFELQNAGKRILSQEEFFKVRAITNAVHARDEVRALMQIGKREQTLFWVDPETGIRCKCRPDFLGDIAVLDLKSTDDASRDGFAKSCHKYGYAFQAAMYLDGIREVTGEQLPFVFIPMEKEPPYAVAVYQASEAFLMHGLHKYHTALRTLAECRDTGKWPAYQPTGQIESIDLPHWAK